TQMRIQLSAKKLSKQSRLTFIEPSIDGSTDSLAFTVDEMNQMWDNTTEKGKRVTKMNNANNCQENNPREQDHSTETTETHSANGRSEENTKQVSKIDILKENSDITSESVIEKDKVELNNSSKEKSMENSEQNAAISIIHQTKTH
ncbi:unnamed protein product, partial [Meganyctiphanes norvegica]